MYFVHFPNLGNSVLDTVTDLAMSIYEQIFVRTVSFMGTSLRTSLLCPVLSFWESAQFFSQAALCILLSVMYESPVFFTCWNLVIVLTVFFPLGAKTHPGGT